MAGIVGWPVAHSLSPRLHGYWLRQLRIDGAYVPLPLRAADFATGIRGLAACGFRGVNVTVPHKQAAFAMCDSVAEAASRAGAVNTLVFAAGRIHGTNTDGAGFLRGLAEQGIERPGASLILGAGGAARAVAVALRDAGARVTITSRRDDAASSLAEALDGVRVLPWSRRAAALGDYAVLVNTTAGGMAGKPALEMDLAAASAGLVVADIVYAPRRTALLDAAAARGLVTVEGIAMLLHQAVLGFASWFGVEPVVDAAVRAFVLSGAA